MADFPLLWTRVIYNGIHAGDFLTSEEAIHLGCELQRLQEADLRPIATEHGSYLRRFLEMLTNSLWRHGLSGNPYRSDADLPPHRPAGL